LLFGLALGANNAPPYDNAWCWEGKPCTDKSQCKEPNGVQGACCNGVCRNYNLGRGELCGPSLSDSSCPPCDANLKCAVVPGTSNTNQCQLQNAEDGCLCTSAVTGNCINLCLPSGYCGPSNVLPGGSCETTQQCYQQSICNVTCQPIPDGQNCPNPGAPFNLCLTTSVCLSGGKCGPPVAFGVTCGQDYDCIQPDLWCSNKHCANRTAIGSSCSATACVVGALCNSGTCVNPRTVADNAACTDPNACVSGYCAGGTCTPTHFRTAGQSCIADEDCVFGATCQNKACTASGLNMACDPTLGGGAMDAQCEYSNDLYCSCDGICLPTDSAILPSGPVVSACQTAKQAVEQLNLKTITSTDINSLTPAERTDLATFQCCTKCNKGARISSVGCTVDCAAKTVSEAPVTCGAFAPDPLALQNCPAHSTSDGLSLSTSVLIPLCLFVFSN